MGSAQMKQTSASGGSSSSSASAAASVEEEGAVGATGWIGTAESSSVVEAWGGGLRGRLFRDWLPPRFLFSLLLLLVLLLEVSEPPKLALLPPPPLDEPEAPPPLRLEGAPRARDSPRGAVGGIDS